MEFTKFIVANDGQKVLCFYNGFCCLSHVHRTPFTLNGHKYCSVYQYVEAMKALHFGDYMAYEDIMKSKTVPEQHKYADRIQNFDWKDWARVEEKHVRVGLSAKLEQHPKIMEALKKTAGVIIAYCTIFDREWGTGISVDSEKITDMRTWGENRLGRLLCEYRDVALGVL